MATGIFRGYGKSKVELSAQEVKNEIMRLRGWSEQEYTRQRKIAQKQIQSYNIYAERAGGERFTKTPTQLLYGETKAQAFYKEEYRASSKIEQVRLMARTSSKQRGEKAFTIAEQKVKPIIESRFSALIEKNAGARKIAESISDPLKREKALSDYADKMHLKIKEKSGEPVPSETFGSDTAMDDVASELIAEYGELIAEYGDNDLEEVNADDLPF